MNEEKICLTSALLPFCRCSLNLKGPVFAELDETLQQEFATYLADRCARVTGQRGQGTGPRPLIAHVLILLKHNPRRGVTDELGEYLRHLIYDREQREYVSWLAKVKDFVK